MSFEEALAAQPLWVQLWVGWMGVVTLASLLVLLFSRRTWRDAAIIVVLSAGAVALMQWLYAELGYVRLLGLAHVVFWTPLAVYLWRRLRDPAIVTPFRQVMWTLLATISLSLVLDYVDVARYLLGEQAPLV